jgi:flagellar motor switch protein FliM
MSDGILTSGELDALRAAVDGDDVPQDEGGRPARSGSRGTSVLIDGEGLPRFVFGEGRGGGTKSEERLSYIFDRAARALERRLSDVLETAISSSVTFLQVTRFDEFRETFELDVRELAMLGFTIAGVPGQGLLALEPEVVERVVEGLMGGAQMSQGGNKTSGRRAFREVSQLDLRVCTRVMKSFLDDLGELWNPADPLKSTITGADTKGVVARGYEDSTQVVAGLLEVVIGKRLLGMVGIVLPRSALDSMADPMAQVEAVGPGDPDGSIAAELEGFEVDVQVMVGRKRMSVSEFLALSEGDIVFFEAGRQQAVGLVQGVPKFVGVPGRSNGNKAICIAEMIDHAS